MAGRTRSLPSEKIPGALEAGGQRFEFYLECQTYDLGPAGPVQYYYMPVSRLRDNDPIEEVSNFRSCIGFWYAATHAAQGDAQLARQANYVLAICYALVNRDKGTQRIYRDALLRPRSFSPEKLQLPKELTDGIRKAVASQDRDAVLRELDDALGAARLTAEDRIGSARAMDHWVGRGVGQLRATGHEGLRAWLGDINQWIKRFRKRSHGRMRTFLDVFATECKLSFYLCYSNFWIGLLRWLEVNRQLDPMSRRFLSIWHFQNRPVEIPHGRTRNGIVYPTAAGRIVTIPDGSGGSHISRFEWKTDHVGPEVIPDVFRGNVLALHPLNWVLLSRNELREKVGGCISSSAFDEAMRTGRVENFTDYWDMIDAVLTAAHLYRIAQLQYESKRSRKSTRERPAAVEPSIADDVATDILLGDCIDSLRRRCRCGGLYRYIAREVPVAKGAVVIVPVACDQCGASSLLKVERQTIEAFLLREA